MAALYFLARGPWRAAGSVNSYDFASVYGAARCWWQGQNPYDMHLVDKQIHSAGDDPATLPNTEPPPSVYLPTAFPLVASIAWLPWRAARAAWSLISVAVFGLSAVLLLRSSNLAESYKWFLAAGILFFSPASSGLSTGNPSVVSCALTLAALLLALRNRILPAALLLGLAHSLKPQISVAAMAVLLLWGYWRILAFSIIVPVFAGSLSFLRVTNLDQYRFWIKTLGSGIQTASLPGGINDPSPANYFSYHLINAASILSIWLNNPRLVTVLVWLTVATLTVIYVWLRSRVSRHGRPLRDIAFFCTIALAPVYHRYYDAQLLLGIVPFLFTRDARQEKRTVAIWGGLTLLLFPLQAIVAESHRLLNPASPAGFLLLRHQPSVVLLLCLFLLPWWRSARHTEGGHPMGTDATVCKS